MVIVLMFTVMCTMVILMKEVMKVVKVTVGG